MFGRQKAPRWSLICLSSLVVQPKKADGAAEDFPISMPTCDRMGHYCWFSICLFCGEKVLPQVARDLLREGNCGDSPIEVLKGGSKDQRCVDAVCRDSPVGYQRMVEKRK
jgi:hypothetical protein